MSASCCPSSTSYSRPRSPETHNVKTPTETGEMSQMPAVTIKKRIGICPFFFASKQPLSGWYRQWLIPAEITKGVDVKKAKCWALTCFSPTGEGNICIRVSNRDQKKGPGDALQQQQRQQRTERTLNRGQRTKIDIKVFPRSRFLKVWGHFICSSFKWRERGCVWSKRLECWLSPTEYTSALCFSTLLEVFSSSYNVDKKKKGPLTVNCVSFQQT